MLFLVTFLSDGYLMVGSGLWRAQDLRDFPPTLTPVRT